MKRSLKQFLCFVFALALVLTAVPFAADASRDGVITAEDARLILRAAVGPDVLT